MLLYSSQGDCLCPLLLPKEMERKVVASSVRRAASMKEQSESRRSSFGSGGGGGSGGSGHAARKSLFKIPVPPSRCSLGRSVVSSSSMKIQTKGGGNDDDDDDDDDDGDMVTSMDMSVVDGSEEGEEEYDSDRSR